MLLVAKRLSAAGSLTSTLRLAPVAVLGPGFSTIRHHHLQLTVSIGNLQGLESESLQ